MLANAHVVVHSQEEFLDTDFSEIFLSLACSLLKSVDPTQC